VHQINQAININVDNNYKHKQKYENSLQILVLMLASKPLFSDSLLSLFIWYKVYIYSKSSLKIWNKSCAKKYVLFFTFSAKLGADFALRGPKKVETEVSKLSLNRVPIYPNQPPIWQFKKHQFWVILQQ